MGVLVISWFKKKHGAVDMHQGAAMTDKAPEGSKSAPPMGTEESPSAIRRRQDSLYEQRWTGVLTSEASPLPVPRAPLESGEHEIVSRRDDRGSDPHAAPLSPPSSEARIRALVETHMDFVWRALRRLGVPESDCDDGCQRVWLVLNRKLDNIEFGKERSYIFSVAVRIASEMRRAGARRAESPFSEATPTGPDSQFPSWEQATDRSNPEGQLQRRQACEALDLILSLMSLELRAVFVMFELEGFSSPEIAQTLGVSRGTVASRLRLARVVFEREVARMEANAEQRARVPSPTQMPSRGEA